jgi:hypothetical protein
MQSFGLLSLVQNFLTHMLIWTREQSWEKGKHKHDTKGSEVQDRG